MPLRVLVIEDIPAIQEAIVKLTSEHPELKVVGAFDNVEETIDFFLDGAVIDALLLDVRLFGDYGWEILRTLNRENITIPPVVLITAEEEKGYAETFFREFRNEVVDYFVKPFDEKWGHRKNECVQNIKDRLKVMESSRERLQRIPIDKGNVTEYLSVDKIVCLLKTDRGLAIYFENRELPFIDAYGNLGKYEKDIYRPTFVRISRQCVVNTHFVSKISNDSSEKGTAHLVHAEIREVECSKPGKKELKKAMCYVH